MNHEETIKRIHELVPSVMELELKCSDCNGDGWYSDHDTPRSHGEYGECTSCPVQVGCETCTGTGIISKPITLAVVLLALVTQYTLDNNNWVVEKLTRIVEKLRQKQISVVVNWNFHQDNFNDQSDETKTLIGGLLNNTE